MEKGIEYINKENMSRYAGLILPEVEEEIASYEDLFDENYVCLGAFEEEGDMFDPVGAIVVRLLESGDIDIQSIKVKQSRRREGIGTELLETVLDIASESYNFEEDENEVTCRLRSTYYLEGEERNGYESFLSNIGFDSESDGPMEFILTSSDLRLSGRFSDAFSGKYEKPAFIKRVADMPEIEIQGILDLAPNGIIPELSFAVGERGERENLLLVTPNGNEGFDVVPIYQPSGVQRGRFLELLRALLFGISREMHDFELYVDARNPIVQEEATSLLGKEGKIRTQHTAWAEITFQK